MPTKTMKVWTVFSIREAELRSRAAVFILHTSFMPLTLLKLFLAILWESNPGRIVNLIRRLLFNITSVLIAQSRSYGRMTDVLRRDISLRESFKAKAVEPQHCCHPKQVQI